MPKTKFQPQLIHNLMYAATDNKTDDMFIVKLNGSKLQFSIREFTMFLNLIFRKEAMLVSVKKTILVVMLSLCE